MRPECFGVEFYDESGVECPHLECLLRQECGKTHQSAMGLFEEKKIKEKAKDQQKKRLQVAYKKQKDAFFDGVLKRGSQYPTQKRGYKKPARLLYKDEGYPKDEYIAELTDFLDENGFECKATKFLHSFSKGNKFLIKVDLRRKNSILVYIRDDLAQMLSEKRVSCRSLYDSELPNFPDYLCWATQLSSRTDVNRTIDCMRQVYGLE